MRDISGRLARSPGSSVPVRVFTVTVAASVVLVGTAVYFRVGWWRMESACSLDGAGGPVHTSGSYDWSWRPLGFQCTYDNGESATSLWF